MPEGRELAQLVEWVLHVLEMYVVLVLALGLLALHVLLLAGAVCGLLLVGVGAGAGGFASRLVDKYLAI